MKRKVIASAPTKEGLQKLINEYYYSKFYVIKEDNTTVENTKTGRILENKVREYKGRWQFYKEEA